MVSLTLMAIYTMELRIRPRIEFQKAVDELVEGSQTYIDAVKKAKLAALDAQARIAEMQGNRNTWFAGAWLRNGFHEDGFASAMRIARRLLPASVLP